MKFMLILLAFSSYVVLTKSSLDELPVHPGVGGLYKGPNSETIIKGPDGSVITAQQQGGSVVTQDLSQPIVVADIEPIQPVQPVVSTLTVAPQAASAPIVASNLGVAAAPVVAEAPVIAAAPVAVAPVVGVGSVVPVGHTVEIIQPDPHIIETEIVDAPSIEPQQSSDLVGPSGSISTRGSSSVVSGPASTTISEPAKVIVASSLVAAVPVISTVITPLQAIVPGPVTSSVSTVTVPSVNTSPGVLTSSTVPPISISTLSPPTILSNTATPPVLLNGDINPRPSNVKALIEPASTYGVVYTPDQAVQELSTPTPEVLLYTSDQAIQVPSTPRPEVLLYTSDQAIQVPSTPRPEVLLSSTLAPVITSDQGNRISSSPLDNRQLNINPSLIPSANIVPPEIGPLPPGAIDLGTSRTVTVTTTPRGPEVVSPTQSPNIQRISSDNSILLENGRAELHNVDGRVDPLYTNQITFTGNPVSNIPPNTQYPLLRDTNPIPAGNPNNGLIGTQLINSPPLSLTNVPLSSVSSIPLTIDQEIDEVSAQLWNRYGRDVKEKNVKEKQEKIRDS